MYSRAVERGILPSMKLRWCCADFKEGAGAGRVTLTGVRRSESARRAKRNEMEVSGKKFSGNAEQFDEWQKKQIEKIKRRMLKKEGKHLGEDYFSIDKDREIRCVGGKDTIIVNPMLQWTERDVWYFLDAVVCVSHCELYDRGYRRIGCILCPMSSHKQKIREMQDYPHVKRGWIKAIKEIRRGGALQSTNTRKCSMAVPIWGGTSKQQQLTGSRWYRKKLTGMWAGFLQALLLTAPQKGSTESRLKTRLLSVSLTGGLVARVINGGMPTLTSSYI